VGKASRDKGNRFERALVNRLRLVGHDAYRIPLSGAQRGFNGDLVIRSLPDQPKLECKSRANGFQKLYQWLVGVKYLALKADREETLITMRYDDFLALLTSVAPKAKPKAPQRLLQSILRPSSKITNLHTDKPLFPCDVEAVSDQEVTGPQ
jgi:hypothetical protein